MLRVKASPLCAKTRTILAGASYRLGLRAGDYQYPGRFPNPQLYKALGFPRRGKPRIYNGVLVRQTARFLEGCSGLGYSANPGLIVFIQVTDTTLPILAMVVWLDSRN